MILFYNQIHKAKPTYFDVLQKLRAILHAEQPELLSFLHSTWKNQKNVVTYKELRIAILNGSLNIKEYQQWQQDYAAFITEKLEQMWKTVLPIQPNEIEKHFVLYEFNLKHPIVKEWIKVHSGELITQLTETQFQAVNSLIQMGIEQGMTVDRLEKIIRPAIGLTAPQAIASIKYYNTVLDGYMKNHPRMHIQTAVNKAHEAMLKYMEVKHRERAVTIAITEIATAYNMGAHLGIQQAQEQGLMGKMVKRSLSAGDKHVCKECKRLDNTTVNFEESFITKWGSKLIPPYHPRCRDVVLYEEMKPPILAKQ